MTVLDLRCIRCPLALVKLKLALKRKLLFASDMTSTSDIHKRSLKVLFSTQDAMSDIRLYLDKKAYQYKLSTDQESFILMITITDTITEKGTTT